MNYVKIFIKTKTIKTDTKTGEFHHNMMHGIGKYFYANGTCIDGRWIKGLRELKCTITAPDKRQMVIEQDYEERASFFCVPPDMPIFSDINYAMNI